MNIRNCKEKQSNKKLLRMQVTVKIKLYIYNMDFRMKYAVTQNLKIYFIFIIIG